MPNGNQSTTTTTSKYTTTTTGRTGTSTTTRSSTIASTITKTSTKQSNNSSASTSATITQKDGGDTISTSATSSTIIPTELSTKTETIPDMSEQTNSNSHALMIGLIVTFVFVFIILLIIFIIIWRMRVRPLSPKPKHKSPLSSNQNVNRSKTSFNQKDLREYNNMPEANEHFYHHIDATDEETHPYSQLYQNFRDVSPADCRSPYPAASDGVRDGCPILTDVQRAPFVVASEAGDASDYASSYFVLESERNSEDYAAANDYFVLEEENGSDNTTDNASVHSSAGYSNPGGIQLDESTENGMTEEKFNNAEAESDSETCVDAAGNFKPSHNYYETVQSLNQ